MNALADIATILGTIVAIVGLPFVYLEWRARVRREQEGIEELAVVIEPSVPSASLQVAAEIVLQGYAKNGRYRVAVAKVFDLYGEEEIVQAAYQGSAEALMILFFRRLDEIMPDPEHAEAIAYALKAADLGNPVAMVFAAELYGGDYLPRDEKKVVELVQRAVRLEHPDGYLTLSGFYKDGKYGFKKDYGCARALLEKSISLGSESAKHSLSILIRENDPYNQEGIELLRSAAQGGVISAKTSLLQLEIRIDGKKTSFPYMAGPIFPGYTVTKEGSRLIDECLADAEVDDFEKELLLKWRAVVSA